MNNKDKKLRKIERAKMNAPREPDEFDQFFRRIFSTEFARNVFAFEFKTGDFKDLKSTEDWIKRNHGL